MNPDATNDQTTQKPTTDDLKPGQSDDNLKQYMPPENNPNRMLLIIFIIVGALIIALIAILIIRHHKSTLVDVEAHKYEATVTITKNAYIPATLLIRPDTEVFFQNQNVSSEGDEGIAHTVLQSKASTDQAQGFSSGQIQYQSGYGYIFRNKGTFHFYDAANINETETIVVK